jgi:hypothetical protein
MIAGSTTRTIPDLRWIFSAQESEGMRMTSANRLVGSVRNNGPEMLNSA